MSKRHHWTEEEVRALHARYMAGEVASALAAEYGRTRSAVTQQFQKYGLPAKGHGHHVMKWSVATIKALHERYAAGETARDLAAEIGGTYQALHWRFRRLGLAVWPAHRPSRGGRKVVRSERVPLVAVPQHEHVWSCGACVVCDEPKETAQYA